jgi:hypothetical protein
MLKSLGFAVVCALAVGCGKKAPDGGKGAAVPIDAVSLAGDQQIADFVDNTSTYKGKTIRIKMHLAENPQGDATLRDLVGQDVKFHGGPADVIVSVPKEMSVPAATSLDWLNVTFTCANGDLNHGNTAVSIAPLAQRRRSEP